MQAGFKPPALAEVQEVYQLTNGIVFDIHERCFFFDLTQICVAHLSWSHQCSLHFGPLRMLSTKELDIHLCCSSWIIGSVSSWILMFVANLHVTKSFEKLQHLKLCPPTYFQQKKRMSSFTSPSHILIIACCLGPFPASPRHSEAQKYPNKTKCYVQRPWWLWERMNHGTGR